MFSDWDITEQAHNLVSQRLQGDLPDVDSMGDRFEAAIVDSTGTQCAADGGA